MIGTFYAISSRQFWLLPISAIGTGCSFGFFMGIGMILRTQMEGNEDEDDKHSIYNIVLINRNPQTGEMEILNEPVYKKHIV